MEAPGSQGHTAPHSSDDTWHPKPLPCPLPSGPGTLMRLRLTDGSVPWGLPCSPSAPCLALAPTPVSPYKISLPQRGNQWFKLEEFLHLVILKHKSTASPLHDYQNGSSDRVDTGTSADKAVGRPQLPHGCWG